jgi:hypothetical protein
MKNKILLSVFLFTLLLNVHAQMNFSFTPSIGTFTEITTGTSPFFLAMATIHWQMKVM